MSDLSWLKESIDKIDQKVDKIDQKFDEQCTILTKQSAILEEHTRRSLAAEENIELLRSTTNNRFKPLEKYADRAKFVFIIIGFLSTIAGGIRLFWHF